jgi:hypothetical protein
MVPPGIHERRFYGAVLSSTRPLGRAAADPPSQGTGARPHEIRRSSRRRSVPGDRRGFGERVLAPSPGSCRAEGALRPLPRPPRRPPPANVVWRLRVNMGRLPGDATVAGANENGSRGPTTRRPRRRCVVTSQTRRQQRDGRGPRTPAAKGPTPRAAGPARRAGRRSPPNPAVPARSGPGRRSRSTPGAVVGKEGHGPHVAGVRRQGGQRGAVAVHAPKPHPEVPADRGEDRTVAREGEVADLGAVVEGARRLLPCVAMAPDV